MTELEVKLEDQKMRAEIAKLISETQRIQAEMPAVIAEAARVGAETSHMKMQMWLAPFFAAAALIGGTAAIMKLFF